jgi:hypothetical protein
MHSGPPNNNMKYSTVEDVMESFPHPILPTKEGEPTIKPSTPPESFYKQTLEPSTLTWAEAL